ncbi:MAG: hypothetical protein IID40_08030 [Planctomycetes bacterium]|nr:hypothetical protein [Planctomycetota bacterium]
MDAETLDCTFRDGRQIDTALVTGTEAAPASVELNAFSIEGREVEIDVTGQSAHVPGRGRMTFLSLRDLDGRRRSEAIPMTITWSENMVFRGLQNRAILTGAVHAATAESVLDCGELIVDFAEPEPAAVQSDADGAGRNSRRNWWIFNPLVEYFAGPGHKQSDRFLGQDFNKEPVLILATGGAVALTTKIDPVDGRVLSRGRIAGPKILVDLRSQVMTIEDAGTLLIEDYERSSSAQGDESDPRTPFGGLGVGSPSQTFITWSGQMAYYFGNQAVVFERGVEMRHRSGSMILGPGMAGESAEASGDSGATGRDAYLSCEELVIQFKERDAAGQPSSGGGAGRMSGFELSRFEATKRVHFQDGGIVVGAYRISFDAERNELAIRGSRNAPAEIYDQRGQFRAMKGPAFFWNRDTNQIDAPNSTMIGR